jgi:patatin-like phospholipase/acyl hydrolase
MEKKFKILSIDGGGIRGIFPAQYLACLEARLEEENKSGKLCDHFDLICGTSTGGIIALGLGLGMKSNEMVELYENHRKDIFQLFNIKFLGKIDFLFI